MAIPCRFTAQSNAESPPPTSRTRLPLNAFGSSTRSNSPVGPAPIMVISLTSCMGFNRNGSPGEKGGERLKIYTKTGDAGETGLFGGGRTPKDSPRVAAYGEVDELNAALGVARALGPEQFADSLLESIQRDLFTIGAELATPDPDKLHKVFAHGRAATGDSGVAAPEQAIDEPESRLEPPNPSILPGGTPQAAALHLSRPA